MGWGGTELCRLLQASSNSRSIVGRLERGDVRHLVPAGPSSGPNLEPVAEHASRPVLKLSLKGTGKQVIGKILSPSPPHLRLEREAKGF